MTFWGKYGMCVHWYDALLMWPHCNIWPCKWIYTMFLFQKCICTLVHWYSMVDGTLISYCGILIWILNYWHIQLYFQYFPYKNELCTLLYYDSNMYYDGSIIILLWHFEIYHGTNFMYISFINIMVLLW